MNSPNLKSVASKPRHKAPVLVKPVKPVPALPDELEQIKAVTSGFTAVEPTDTALVSVETRRRRGNKRSEQTVDNILTATEQVILKSGTDRISILEVCNAAGVSRGTFYRYFASQEELLDAFSRHRRENFHKMLSEALSPCVDPDLRFATMIEYVDSYLASGRSRRMLLVAPEFALKFFKRIFHDAVVRFQDLLAPVFDAWDERLESKLDRELICELIVRFMLSEHLIGDDSDRRAMPRRIMRLVDSLRRGGGGLVRR